MTENKGDLISRKALKKAFEEVYPLATNEMGGVVNKQIYEIIDNAPTVEYTFEEAFQKTVCEQRLYCPQRPQGEWIKQYGKSYELKTNEGIFVGEFTKCPKCQYDKARGSNFCPNCGASMKKGGAK